MDDGRIRRALFAVFSGVLAACSATPARAQAWLPPKGEALFSFGYGDVFVNKHYLGTGDNAGDSVETTSDKFARQGLGTGWTNVLPTGRPSWAGFQSLFTS